ncbi:PRTRC system protein A [Rhodanobacter sp. FW106-PBR-R2A-1-13]|uniref:PRTRC system protein A n=1 Tax=Rhodanobacter sp. FW106-PBR-R2A-1-13 TaxID=3454845 RepID=UPI0034E441D3
MNLLATSAPGALDLAILAALPLVAVPVEGAFEPLTQGRRLLLARDGLYIEAANAGLYVRRRIVGCSAPWGQVSEAVILRQGAIPASVASELGRAARGAYPNEMAALVLATPDGGYAVHHPYADATGGSVSYADTGYDEDALVIDAHSHGEHPAYFSRMDDDSDRSRIGPHLSVVFGRCAPGGSIEVNARVCVGDYLLPMNRSEFEELFA